MNFVELLCKVVESQSKSIRIWKLAMSSYIKSRASVKTLPSKPVLSSYCIISKGILLLSQYQGTESCCFGRQSNGDIGIFTVVISSSTKWYECMNSTVTLMRGHYSYEYRHVEKIAKKCKIFGHAVKYMDPVEYEHRIVPSSISVNWIALRLGHVAAHQDALLTECLNASGWWSRDFISRVLVNVSREGKLESDD